MKAINFSDHQMIAMSKVFSQSQGLKVPEVLITQNISEGFKNFRLAVAGLQHTFDLGDLPERLAVTQNIISKLISPLSKIDIPKELLEASKLMGTVTSKHSSAHGTFCASAGRGNINYHSSLESLPDFHPMYNAKITIIID